VVPFFRLDGNFGGTFSIDLWSDDVSAKLSKVRIYEDGAVFGECRSLRFLCIVFIGGSQHSPKRPRACPDPCVALQYSESSID